MNNTEIDGDGNIVIQGLTDTNITIHTGNPLEIKKFLIDFKSELLNLPHNVLSLLVEKQNIEMELTSGANIFLNALLKADSYLQAYPNPFHRRNFTKKLSKNLNYSNFILTKSNNKQ